MGMFCFQCQETAKGTGCEIRRLRKTEDVAKLQDLLIYTLKGIRHRAERKVGSQRVAEINHELLRSLFMTITNANFDGDAIEAQIRKMLSLRDNLRAKVSVRDLHDAAVFTVDTREEMLEKAAVVGVLATKDEDIRSLREMMIYGLKGMAAYSEHL